MCYVIIQKNDEEKRGNFRIFFEETIHQLKTIFYYSFCFIMLKKNKIIT
jgi:hypothetical protein